MTEDDSGPRKKSPGSALTSTSKSQQQLIEAARLPVFSKSIQSAIIEQSRLTASFLQGIREGLELQRSIAQEISNQGIAAQLRAAQEMTRGLRSQIDELHLQASHVARAYQSLLPAFRFAEDQARQLRAIQSSLSFGISGQVLEALREGMRRVAEECEPTASFEEIEPTLEAAIRDSSVVKGLSPAQISTLFNLLLFLITMIMGHQNQEEILDAIDSSTEAMGSAIAAAVAAAVDSADSGQGPVIWFPTHFSSRDLHIRQGPSATSGSLGVVRANGLLEVLSIESGWAECSVYLHEEKTVVEGWVFGRDLHELGPEFRASVGSHDQDAS